MPSGEKIQSTPATTATTAAAAARNVQMADSRRSAIAPKATASSSAIQVTVLDWTSSVFAPSRSDSETSIAAARKNPATSIADSQPGGGPAGRSSATAGTRTA